VSSLSAPLASLALLSCGGPVSEPPREPAVLIRRAGKEPLRVRVELAKTPAERSRGLMHRERLADDTGMLFLFDRPAVQSFWMKNTLIPLDMIFIADDLKVVGVVENAEPMTLAPRTVGIPSRYVLEVVGGFAAPHGIKSRTTVDFVHVPEGGMP
jgi:hypothetical protein